MNDEKSSGAEVGSTELLEILSGVQSVGLDVDEDRPECLKVVLTFYGKSKLKGEELFNRLARGEFRNNSNAPSVPDRLKSLVRPCVTHHYACDCREALMVELLKDVMACHSDPNDPDYNECDTDPCQWCEDARKLLGPNAKAETSERSGDSSQAPCSAGLWDCPCGYSYHNGVNRCVKCGAYQPNSGDR